MTANLAYKLPVLVPVATVILYAVLKAVPMDQPTLFAVTPLCSMDPSIAIAACRAGSVGILDLEFTRCAETAESSLDRLKNFTGTPFGVKLGPGSWETYKSINVEADSRLRWILLAGGDSAWISEAATDLHRQGRKVLVEAVSCDEALDASSLPIDGLILKGNESGGRVGEETAFILLQHWSRIAERHGLCDLPFWMQGGIGPNAAAACVVAGAVGVVLDSQLLLARESSVAPDLRRRIEAFDGSDTIQLGLQVGSAYRVWAPHQSPRFDRLQEKAASLAAANLTQTQRQMQWRSAIEQHTWEPLTVDSVLMCGQDAALAGSLGGQFRTVGGIVSEVLQRIRRNRQIALELQPLAADAPLAVSHGTRFPLLQGPMTRVSDTAEFAYDVASAGGMPFLALALMRGAEAEEVLAETAERLADRPWGVGQLGFLPAEIRREQTEAILQYRPTLAIIAGGRPDQASDLEEAGIATYLHVPSPGLLHMFLRDGARRFIFEGRECGGHVGPRSSFVLWETMCEALLEHLGTRGEGAALHVVFAGGIHNSLSGAALSCLAAPLAARGVKIGALMGTAYLFTQEAVKSGAIVSRFQNEALTTQHTVLLETGPGHAIRCAPTPYCDLFNEEKDRLRSAGHNHDEIVQSLEWMNVGRLRVASKGLDRIHSNSGAQSQIAQITEDEQFQRGMYMIGQVAALREQVTSIADLHEEVCTEAARRLEQLPVAITPAVSAPKPCDVAIVGMSALYPGAVNVDQYWENILARRNVVTEIPATHWDWKLYYDSNPLAHDKIISRWGGFLGDVPFDPLTFGITPKSLASIEPLQLLVLNSVRQALGDAGYDGRPFDRENTCTVLGVGGGGSAMAVSYGLRACLPMFDTVKDLGVSADRMLEKIGSRLPEWTEDSFPGILLNVTAGRVANRFDLGGSNYALDAACASSLAAVHACIRELQLGTANVAIAIGADTVQTPLAYMAFSKTHALSQRGRCCPFDADADGIVLSEGVGVVILKRLADAERDGDRILAVVKGIGSSSDGMDKGLTAPNSAGQTRAIRRALDQAGFSPSDLTLIEAHGTGTVVGDRTEALSLSRVMQEAGAKPQSCAVGSVKSMIGHSKCAAGIAGLIKTVKALDSKTLPPTLVDNPNPNIKFSESALYLNTEARPWVHRDDRPRRAGVSSFGFGGTNVHMALEEYRGDYLDRAVPAQLNWPAELLLWRRSSRGELINELETLRQSLQQGAKPSLNELAAAVWQQNQRDATARLAIVAVSIEDLERKLSIALQLADLADEQADDPRGVYFSAADFDSEAKVACLFPGQGSQYPNMAAPLAMNFPVVRSQLDHAEQLLAGRLEQPLGHYIYPPSPFTDSEQEQLQRALASTSVAQPAIGAVSSAIYRLLLDFGLEPDMVGGHSYGEYVALWAAEVLTTDELLDLSLTRGQLIQQATRKDEAGGMVAIDGSLATAEQLAGTVEGVSIANVNAPGQIVLSGTDDGLEQLLERARESAVDGRRLPVACAFHSPLVEDANKPLASELREYPFRTPTQQVFSNVTAATYPNDPDGIRELLSRHLTSPVQFAGEIEAMYAGGASVFVEVGPGSVLTGLVKRVLNDQPHLAVATDIAGRDGIVQLLHTLGRLAVQGVPLCLDELYRYRRIATPDLPKLLKQNSKPEYSPSTWLVNGIRSRPHQALEPELIGTWPRQAGDHNGVKPQIGKSDVVAKSTDGTFQPAEPSSPVSPTSANRPVMQQKPIDPNLLSRARDATTEHKDAPKPSSTEQDRSDDEMASVMLGFQNVMAKFLDTQRSVMLGYLQADGSTGDDVDPDEIEGYSSILPTMDQQAAVSEIDNRSLPPSGTESQSNDRQIELANRTNLELAVELADSPSNAESRSPEAHGTESNNGSIDWDIGKIESLLLDLLSDRTGYPKDMLDSDLDLEADLGIDSIKRVEIFGGLTESLDGARERFESRLEMEKLTSLRSLRGILEYLDEVLFSDNGAVPSHPPLLPNHKESNDEVSSQLPEIQRGLVQLIEAPLPRAAAIPIPSGAVLITDDGRGVARQISERLADLGQPAVLIKMRTADSGEQGKFAADLTDPTEVAALVERLRNEMGPIAGLIHTMPLAPVESSANLSKQARRDVKSLYLLARELELDLRAAGADGNAFLLAATGLGGDLGYGQRELDHPALAAHGGVLGMVKCIGLEWPEVLVRAVDFDTRRRPAELADCLLRELASSDGPMEVGYREATRLTWQPIAAPLDTSDSRAKRTISPDSTILMTGGARGITAEIAAALGDRYRPNLILVGSTKEPTAEESPDTASAIEPADVKRALLAGLDNIGKKVQPAEVEARYRQILKEREIRANLDRLRSTGAHVEYHAIDVRDEDSLARLIAEVTERFGGIDAVIHGAGVIDDKLLRDKTPESFDHVLGVKVDGAAALSRLLNFEELQFCAFFASVASRFGNRGQSDYAAANEILSKYAMELDRRWPARVFTIAWGPWERVGMVADLEKHLEARGVTLIDPAMGAERFIEELEFGWKGESEVLIAGGAERLQQQFVRQSEQVAS